MSTSYRNCDLNADRRACHFEQINGATMSSTAAGTQHRIAPASSRNVVDSGKWGGRWSGSAGRPRGGMFGFAADDLNLPALAAFTSRACASGAFGR